MIDVTQRINEIRWLISEQEYSYSSVRTHYFSWVSVVADTKWQKDYYEWREKQITRKSFLRN